MPCDRCAADPRPNGAGSDQRRCAFDDDGYFTSDNWQCATLEALMDACAVQTDEGAVHGILGNDESLQACYRRGNGHGGWIILTRYKRRGRTTSAIHVGDFWPPRPVTLALAEEFLA